MKTHKLRFIVGAALLASVLPGGSWAQGARVHVQKVVVEGNREVSTDKIVRVMRLERGSLYDPGAVQGGLERLYATHQFNDLQAYREAGTQGDSVVVVIVVSEFPKTDIVRYQGNKHVDKEELSKIVKITKGSFVRPALVAKDREAIESLYREKGYYRATMTDTIVVDPRTTERVLEYRILEGGKVSVQHIDFIGVEALDTRDVRQSVKLKERKWWRGADFKPGVFEEDDKHVVDLYKSRGYLDVEIKDKELVFSDDGKNLDIFITIDEGPLYYVGNTTWSGNDFFPDSTISNRITMVRGEPFDEIELSRIQFDIGNAYWDRGYIYSTVTPVKTVNGKTVDVNFEITQGNLTHVREINITGNTKTAENIIRRELVISPGDVFAASRLRRSLREVFNLGFFAAPPDPSFQPANEEGDVDLTLRLEEKPAGQFRMGAGFSQLNRVSGFIGVTEPNFRGRGLRVGLDWEFSRFRQNVNVSFTEPWFLGTPTDVSLSVYAQNQNQVNQQFFSDRRTGFSMRVGRPFPWMDYTSAFVRYSLEEVELSNFSPAYQGSLLLTDWPQTTSSLGLTMLRNSTDNPFHPTLGTRTMVSGTWTGGAFGGDIGFQRYEGDFSWYYPLLWKFVFQFRDNVGIVDGLGKTGAVPDYEKFRLGGNRRYGLRGYDFYEVVPDGNPLFVGGQFMNIMTYEVSFPIAAPTVYALGFFDAGNTWNSFGGADILDVKKGAGLGIRIELPMLGTVGMDYGYGFDRRGGGSWEPHITFGGGF